MGIKNAMIDLTQAPRRVLVVAAHPDDDAIGCGGTMAMVSAAGGTVCVAYLTDGSQSHPGSRRFSPADVAAIREHEAVDALEELGVTADPLFFRLPDSELASLAFDERTRVVSRLADFVRSFEPDLILAPWDRDPHPDHMAAAAIARLAVQAALRPVAFAGYDVWLSIRGAADDRPQPGEVTVATVNLSEQARDAKRRALFAHRSQTSDLIDDDPGAFRITGDLAERWLGASETFFFSQAGKVPVC
jgi:LmbE family N-acetylglucosaminyl deacetylase